MKILLTVSIREIGKKICKYILKNHEVFTIENNSGKKKKSEKLKRPLPLKNCSVASHFCGIIDYLISLKSSYTNRQDIFIDGAWLVKNL
jgi:hypothetical protein